MSHENSNSDLSVSDKDRKLLLDDWQDTQCAYDSEHCIHAQFSACVRKHPDKTALIFRDKRITYQELDERSNRLARRLQSCGVKTETLVGVCVSRSIEMVVALLGILKAGGAYVPLDPAYPHERLAMMLQDSGAKFLVSQRSLEKNLPRHEASLVFLDDQETLTQSAEQVEVEGLSPENLSYVIFTSGSTGRPKGVMVQHSNVSNFFTGMDERIGTEPGVWLAVTSISFDISVLEIFWTLCRGFTVVIQEESDRASLAAGNGQVWASNTPLDFSLFYFASESKTEDSAGAYRVMLEGAQFADAHHFSAVWTPERHFHEFGGIYPNPAVTTAALAAVTKNVDLRAGSVVLPLHDPIRVAEDWAVIDNISQGRVGMSFASGWHSNDFALMPANYADRREVMLESIRTIRKLWRGETIPAKNGDGVEIQIRVFPRPVQKNPPVWIATAGNTDTFRTAGKNGFNILTNMLGQDIKALKKNFDAYREARKEAGHEGLGKISVMLHTFVCENDEQAMALAKGPFCNYMATSYDLVKVAPWMFPAYKQPSNKQDGAFDAGSFDEADQAALLDHAFERYFETAGLFGSPERALAMVEELKSVGATEVCCLVDFGIDAQVVLDNLKHLNRLREISNPAAQADSEDYSAAAQMERHQITHLQCTPSMARILVAEGALPSMGSLKKLMLGGEALPVDLVETLTSELNGDLVNMYGPTETTIWSTTSPVKPKENQITIGRPIANTTIRILSPTQEMLPIGEAGELCIGGAGVVRGYFGQPEMTAERFIDDPYQPGTRLYRTGDLARYRMDGELEFLGRLDQQVKLNGYRIEMGEIESVLCKHPAVRDSVVVARADGGPTQLVAYVVPSLTQGSGERGGVEDGDHVASWEKLWSNAYQQGVGAAADETRFDTSGWLDSFTGEPIAQDQMRRWLDATIGRILELKPKSLLEIGCGTGMILYGCLGSVDHYTGVEISTSALKNIEDELSGEERHKTTLINKAAHELADEKLADIDLVVINSVAQYFPSEEYLLKVLQAASLVVSDGGNIFLGDLRCLDELKAFHTEVELHQAPGQSSAAALQSRIEERQQLESELLVSHRLFQNIERRVPRLRLKSIQLKREEDDNEMSKLRYDVVLSVNDKNATELQLPEPVRGVKDIQMLQGHLQKRPDLLLAEGIANARLSNVRAAMQAIEAGEGNAEDLRRALTSQPSQAIGLEMLFAADPAYDAEVRWGAQPGTVDVLYRSKESQVVGFWAIDSSKAEVGPLTNVPAQEDDSESLIPALRRHLKDFLPEYMIPSAYVLLDQLPLTPNGKIDRKALPAPGLTKIRPAAAYVMPENELEKVIAEIWQDMLGIDRVGTKDNIFDLGASSLLTVEANSRLSKAMGKKVPLVNMFRYPTIEALAAHLGGETGEAKKESAQRTGDREERRKAAAERRRRARAERAN